MKELSGYLPKVLISHSWQDKMQAVQIADGLKEIKCANVWIDFEQMGAGDSISNSIRENLSDSNYMLLVWTSNTVNNSNVYNEIKWAKEFNVPVIACYFEFDKNNIGLPEIPIELELNDTINVDFRNINAGVLSLFDQFAKGYKVDLPTEIQEEYNPKLELIKKVNEANSYLINFNKVKGNPEQRAFWIKRMMPIIEEISKFDGNKEFVQLFMENLGSLKETDPQAYEVVLPYLEKWNPSTMVTKRNNFTIPSETKNISSNKRIEQIRQQFLLMVERENNENLTYTIAKPFYPDASEVEMHNFIQDMINKIGETITLLLKANRKAEELKKSEGFNPIFEFLTAYYFQIEDVRNDNMGSLGWMDDCYLCMSSLKRVNDMYQKELNKQLVNVPLEDSISYFKQFLNEDEITKLDKMADEKFSTIDWGTILLGLAGVALIGLFFGSLFGGNDNQNTSLNQENSSGGYSEDRMAKTAASIGFSGNFYQSPDYN